MRKKLLVISRWSLVISLLLLASLAFAQVEIKTNIPGVSDKEESPCAIVFGFYKYAMMIGGILAFGAIVYGGVKYTLAAGNPGGQSEGKEWIKGALLGLLLLVSAYLILNTINPDITKCTLTDLAELTPVPSPTPGPGPGPGPTACSAALSPLYSQQACDMDKGSGVVWSSPDPSVQKNLNKLAVEFGKFQSALVSLKLGLSVSANSVHRPLEYQQHLYEVWQAYKQIQNGSLTNCSIVEAEYNRHGLGSVVGTPGCSPNAPHVLGIGIDINAQGIPGGDADTRMKNLDSKLRSMGLGGINSFLSSRKVDLSWQAKAGDEVHFNLLNYPSKSCALGAPDKSGTPCKTFSQ